MVPSRIKNNGSKIPLILAAPMLIMLFLTACGDPDETITLATTTSTENSGLLEEILPHFEETHGIQVKVVSVGTGAALNLGRGKDADVLLVHAPSLEEAFIKEGYGTKRYPVMVNDYVILGPPEDPAGVTERASENVLEALRLIWEGEETFVSRGDQSGTHLMELDLLERAGLSPEGDFYISAGQGMGAVIEMTNQMGGYTLADRGTFLSIVSELDLQVVTQGDDRLSNPYSVIPVTPDEEETVNTEGATTFRQWITSTEVQEMIGAFGVEEYGEPLFIPDAR